MARWSYGFLVCCLERFYWTGLPFHCRVRDRLRIIALIFLRCLTTLGLYSLRFWVT
jgi:hypothetical protein